MRGLEIRIKPNCYRVWTAIGCKINMEQQLDVARLSINPVPGREIMYLFKFLLHSDCAVWAMKQSKRKKTILCPQNMFDDIFTQLGCKQSPAWMRTGIIGPFQILLQQNFNLRRKVAFLSKLFLLRRRNACCIYMSSCIVYILIQLIQPIFWYCSQDLCHGYYSPPYGYIFPLIFSSFFFSGNNCIHSSILF